MKQQSTSFVSFQAEIAAELERVLEWWITHSPDSTNGGFWGSIAQDNTRSEDAPKGIIQHSRILWTFSAAARAGHRVDTLTALAKQAFDYLRIHFWDQEFGGLYWMLDAKGIIIEDKKQIYAQAFGIYAFSEYFQLTGDQASFDLALALYQSIEKHSYDKAQGGYFEAFNRDWSPREDLRLSDLDANEAKTMNTHLHILEAYTNLYRVYPGLDLEAALAQLIQCFLQRFLDAERSRLHLFFDEHWQLKSTEISFGHDIEASWLLVEAAEVLSDESLLRTVHQVANDLAQHTLEYGLDPDGGLLYEADLEGLRNTDKHWWPQAEAMVGFLHAYQRTQQVVYSEAMYRIWQFTKRCILDLAQGEWRWRVNRAGEAIYTDQKAGPWKAPYHNVRALLLLLASNSSK